MRPMKILARRTRTRATTRTKTKTRTMARTKPRTRTGTRTRKAQQQDEVQEQDALLCNCFSTNLFVLLHQAQLALHACRVALPRPDSARGTSREAPCATATNHGARTFLHDYHSGCNSSNTFHHIEFSILTRRKTPRGCRWSRTKFHLGGHARPDML